MILDILTAVLVIAGCAFFTAGTVGLLRFHDLHTKLHALTKADNLGLGLIVVGLVLQVDSVATALKLLLVWALALLAAATNAHLLARDHEGPA